MNEFSYRRSAVEGASSVALVIMLYDRLVADIQRAMAAMQRNDIEGRCQELKHALLILAQLEGTLDHERGGTAARNLASFYSYARARIMDAQIKMDAALLQEVIGHVMDVRGAWQKVEPASRAAEAVPNFPRVRVEGEGMLSFSV
jgi:flagellar protein FliS